VLLAFARTVNSRVSLLRIISGHYPNSIKGLSYVNIVTFWWFDMCEMCARHFEEWRCIHLHGRTGWMQNVPSNLNLHQKCITAQANSMFFKMQSVLCDAEKILKNFRFQTVLSDIESPWLRYTNQTDKEDGSSLTCRQNVECFYRRESASYSWNGTLYPTSGTKTGT
jgi:hypothetical protein